MPSSRAAAPTSCAASRSSSGVVRGHHREAQARGALGDGRRADPLGEDAALQQPLAELHRPLRRRRPRPARSGSRAAGRQPLGRRAPRAASPRSPAGARPARARPRAAPAPPPRRRATGGGGAVEKMKGRAVLSRYSTISRAGADVGAVGAERLAERADDEVDLAAQPRGGDRAAAARPDRAGRVRLVDHQPAAVAAGQLDQLLQRRDVAVHREDAVGDDQRGRVPRLRAGPRRGARGRRGGRRRSRPGRGGSRRRCWRG